MFTLQQIKTAHARVKSGADFPNYIQEIKSYGLKKYVFSVVNGATTYYGESGHQVMAPAIYEPQTINPIASSAELSHIIRIHQEGKTDFLTFCRQAAEAGVKQWVIDTERMLCVYEDIDGRQMIAEPIPEISY